MFCPKCGESGQQENTYCRNCGTFLPDFEKLKKKEIAPEVHFRANYVLSLMTAVVALSLAVTLFAVFLGKESTPVLIYIVAGFLIAMSAWQIQTFWRTLLLKRHFKNFSPASEDEEMIAGSDRKHLPEADFDNFIPAGQDKRTTNKLEEKVKTGSPETEHQKG